MGIIDKLKNEDSIKQIRDSLSKTKVKELTKEVLIEIIKPISLRPLLRKIKHYNICPICGYGASYTKKKGTKYILKCEKCKPMDNIKLFDFLFYPLLENGDCPLEFVKWFFKIEIRGAKPTPRQSWRI